MADEKTMTFDNLENTVSADDASARGDLFEPTDVVDPFETVDTLLNGDEEGPETATEPKADGKDADPEATGAAATATEGGDTGEGDKDAGEDTEQGLPSGMVENIPYPRFKKEVDKGAALRAENEQLKAELDGLRKGGNQQQQAPAAGEQEAGAAPPAPDGASEITGRIKDLSREYTDAVIDGDSDRAAELNAQLIDLQADLAAEKAAARATASMQESKVMAEVNTAIDGIMDRHGDFFDDPLNLDQFNAVKNYYISKEGKSLVEALQAAEVRIFGGGEAPAASTGKDSAADSGADGALPKEEQERIRAAQRKRAVEKNVSAANSQPPRMSGAMGNRSPAVASPAKNGLTMTQKELDALPKTELAKLRGDVF